MESLHVKTGSQPEPKMQKTGLPKGIVLVILAALITLACTCSTDNLPASIKNLIGGEPTATIEPVIVATVESTVPATLAPTIEPVQSQPEPATAAPTTQTVPQNQGAQSNSATVLLEDDFSDPNSGWEDADYDAGSVGYYGDGTYFVTSTASSKAMWGVAYQDFADVSIEVTASQISAPDNNNNDYGVMCRMTQTSGYSFNISGDGYYSIQRMDNNSFSNLIEWTRSNTINMGNSTNTIKAICNGSLLTLYVNGEKLAEVTDTTYTTGDIALATTTYEDATSEVHFDNILVTVP